MNAATLRLLIQYHRSIEQTFNAQAARPVTVPEMRLQLLGAAEQAQEEADRLTALLTSQEADAKASVSERESVYP